MDGTAVKEIERLAKAADAATIELNGENFATTAIWRAPPPEKEPEPATLELSTLQGLVDYTRDEGLRSYAADRVAFIHVESPTSVRLCTGIFGERNQQVVLARATAIAPKIPFGQWMEPEAFNIGLMAHFAGTGDRGKVLSLTGNIRAESAVQIAEDGVSQSVTAVRGIQRRANEPVPTTVRLAPWRTFSEIQPQPESDFILRVKANGEDRLPTCALFEADGGVWRLDAVKAAKDWLRDALGDEIKVYG